MAWEIAKLDACTTEISNEMEIILKNLDVKLSNDFVADFTTLI